MSGFAPGRPLPSRPTARLALTVLSVMAGIGLATVAGVVFLVCRFASQVHVTGTRNGVRVDTPLGTIRAQKREKIDPKLLGMPLYPNATIVKGKAAGARVDLDLDFADQSLEVMVVNMETPDPADKVIDFYRREAPGFLLSHRPDGSAELHWGRGRLKKVVVIDGKRAKTCIALANAGEPEAN
jgi:hypothetical protein